MLNQTYLSVSFDNYKLLSFEVCYFPHFLAFYRRYLGNISVKAVYKLFLIT